MRKAQFVSAAEQHDFYRVFGDPAEVGFGEVFEVEPGPGGGVNLAAGEQQALLVARAVDQDVVFAVAGKERYVAFDIQMQFHMAAGSVCPGGAAPVEFSALQGVVLSCN